MKNVLKKIIIFTSIFLIPITSVYAEAGFSGSGVVPKTSGGGGGDCRLPYGAHGGPGQD